MLDLSVLVQGEGQCGFFRFLDQPAEKARKPSNYAQASDGGTGYEGTAEGDKPPGGGSQALQCHCGQDAVEITSHSAANPDRIFYKCPKTQVCFPDHSHIAALPNSSTNPTSQFLDCSYWLKHLYCCLVLHKIPRGTCHIMRHQWRALQAEGRCRFFKWQDELGNGPIAPQQQPGPAARQPSSPQGGNPHGNWTSNTSQGVPAAAAGGSGVFADEGELMLDVEGQIWQPHDTIAASTPIGSIILMLMPWFAIICALACSGSCCWFMQHHNTDVDVAHIMLSL